MAALDLLGDLVLKRQDHTGSQLLKPKLDNV